MSDKREILFRGKENPSGKWIEGFLVGNCHIGDWVNATPVHSRTVGQFTGLTDKNGKKIFEGDILRIYDTHNVKVTFAEGCFNVEDKIVYVPVYNYEKAACEVIGNIHDNPELLKETSNV